MFLYMIAGVEVRGGRKGGGGGTYNSDVPEGGGGYVSTDEVR